MTGIGGVFPNFEDHQLDKKKISEFFRGNFHEVYYPINYTSKSGPWQYHIPADMRNFMDMSTLTWNGRIKVVETADVTKDVIDATKIHCSVVNNFIHSVISKISYQINDFQMGDSAALSYSYRAYLDNLLSFSSAAKKQSLKYHGFVKDTFNKFDDVEKVRANNGNEGFKERAEIFCSGDYFHFSVKLRIDLANIDQFIQPGTQLRFTIDRNSDQFALLCDTADGGKYSFDIKDTSLELDKMIPTDNYWSHFQNSISKRPLIYTYDHVQIHTFNYPARLNDLSIQSMFHTDKLPSYFIFALITDEAYLGAANKNPYKFEPFNLKEFYLLVNGFSYPTQPIRLDFDSKDYHHVYTNDFLDRLKLKNSNESIGISDEDWKTSNFFLIADLTVDRCANFHEHQSQPGTINLKMITKTPLSQTTRLIVYSSSRERFTINHLNGEVTSTLSM